MKTRQAFIAAVAALTFAACDDKGSTDVDGSAEVTGTYTLQTVNGSPLPFVIAQIGADMFEVLDGSITLRSNMTFTDSTTFRVTEAGGTKRETDVATGTYARSGSTITFTPEGGSQYVATHSGSTLTQTIESFVLVYRK